MSSSKEPIAPPIIDPSQLAIRLTRELTCENSDIRREPDLNACGGFTLGDKMEFLLRVTSYPRNVNGRAEEILFCP